LSKFNLVDISSKYAAKAIYKLVVVTALTLPIFGSNQLAKAQDTYGATAYSPTSDATGISWDHATEKEALNAAVAVL
jgi:hypothetical protein